MPCVLALALGACASGAVVPPDLSAEELVQLAQEATDRNRYDLAARYYAAVLERFSGDLDMACAAEYEIAFIHYKQKKTALARKEFAALLARYDGPDGALLPQKYRILSQGVLERLGAAE